MLLSMPKYAAFIGHQPHLSLAELASAVPGFKLKNILGSAVALFESNAELPSDFLSTLGGTVVIARELNDRVTSTDDIPGALVRELTGTTGKVTFGLRTFGLEKKEIGKLYRNGKDTLKRAGKTSRYVGSDMKAAPSVVLHDERLLDGNHGCELVVVKTREELWVGRTVAAQDIDAYTKRDMEKPVRDTTAGLLPPKLAQILLNYGTWLARGAKKEGAITVYDPFCGTGVIPMETMIRQWPVLASDVATKAVTGCEKNLEWVRKHWKIGKREVPSAVWKHDALKPFKIDPKLKLKPDVIVTETFLGPQLKERPTSAEAKKLKTNNEQMQVGFIKNAVASLPGVPLVVTWPVWYLGKAQVLLEKTWATIDKLGYEAVLPEGIQSDIEGRPSLIYRRPDQFVGRQIVMLRPKK